MSKNKNMKGRGFTLIELLVVISIISLLSSIVLATFSAARDKARIARGLQFEATMYHRWGADAVGIWKFDEGVGSTVAKDSSGNGKNLLGVDPNSWYTPGDLPSRGTAYSFNGAITLSSVNNNIFNTSNSGLTYMAWIKPGPPPSFMTVMSTVFVSGGPGGGSLEHYFGVTSTKLLYFSGTGGAITGNTILGSDKWYHIAVSVNQDGHPTLYLDGQVEAQNSSVTIVGTPLTDMYIGGYNGPGNKFVGVIDEVHFYNRSLGVAEIQQIYAEGAPEFLAKN